MRTVDVFALGAVTLCIAGTVECSRKVREHPPLVASLVFFALSWALLLPYYYLQANQPCGVEQEELGELLTAYSAILWMLTAVPLRKGLTGFGHSVDAINFWAMRALYLIVVPHGFALIPQVQGLIHARTVAVTHLVLAITGFVLILRALWLLTGKHSPWTRPLWWILFIVTTVYGTAQISYGLKVLMRTPECTAMPDSYKWLFVSLKIVFCFVFLAIVLLICRSRPVISAAPPAFGSSQQAPERGR
jgi:hypothetical protein